MTCYNRHMTNNREEFAYNISNYEYQVYVNFRLLGRV